MNWKWPARGRREELNGHFSPSSLYQFFFRFDYTLEKNEG